MKTTYRIEYKDLCFAIISEKGTVITAANVAKWTIGKRSNWVVDWYKSRGGKVIELKDE